MEISWGQFFDAGIAGAILAALFYFVDKRFWVWFTKQYWPAKQKQAEAQQQVLMGIRDAIVGIQALFSSNEESQRQTILQLDQIAENQVQMARHLSALNTHLTGKGLPPTEVVPSGD